MKKNFKKLVSIGTLALLVLPLVIFGQTEAPNQCIIRRATGISDCPSPGQTAIYDNTYGTTKVRGAICCLMSSIYYLSDWVFTIVLTIAVFIGIWGGYTYMSSGGAEDKLKKGRDWILYSLVGVGIALLARAIPAVAKTIMGV
jgi:hypothetical protein